MPPKNQTALITGASGGIGLDLATLFAQDGFDLILVARSTEKLEQVAAELSGKHGIQAHVLPADLSVAGAATQLAEEVARRGWTVDVLVNNAGVGSYGAFAEVDLERQMKMIQLNVNALTELTGRLLPGMIERKRGRILNVASTAAFQPGPLMAVYYATKAFVLSFSEAIANELEGSGVTVTALCPGPTETGFKAEARLDSSKLFQGGIMASKTVAAMGYRALMKGQPVVITGFKNWLLANVVRFVPRRMVVESVRRAQERVHS